MEVEGLEIPLAGVRFYRQEEAVPEALREYAPGQISLTSCQAARQAASGDVVLLTRENIGCIAAAVSLGLVDENQETPLEGSRVYTDLMKAQSGMGEQFHAPTPKDFTDGTVYACRESHRADFCLFGAEDSGRYRSREIARQAIRDMAAIQPPVMQAVFFFSLEFDELDLRPDVVVLRVRPVELARIVQAYSYNSGRRVTASMGPLRAVNSDLIVRPYLTGEINVSPFCLGSRLIAEYEADRMGMGIPFALFEEIVAGMEDSRTGFPFPLYRGARGL